MMADELSDLRKQCITSLYSCVENVANFIDGKEKDSEITKLKSFVQEYCMQEARSDVANQALEKAKDEIDPSNLDLLNEKFNFYLSRLASEKVNANNHPYMREFNARVAKVHKMARQNLDESDLAITESQEHHIDPITKKPIVDPVRNTLCGHIYEKDSITEFIGIGKKRKCPVAGCGNREPLQSAHLINDDELKFRLTLTQHSTMIQEKSIMDLDDSNL